MADFPPNLDDGEHWLPSDIFIPEAPPKRGLVVPTHLSTSCMDDFAKRFVAFTFLAQRNVSKPPSAQRFGPVRFGLENPTTQPCQGCLSVSNGFQSRQRLNGFNKSVPKPNYNGSEAFYEYQLRKPVQLQPQCFNSSLSRNNSNAKDMAFLWCKQSQTFKKVAGNIVIVGLVGCLATIFLLSLISFSNYVDSKSGPQTEPLQLYLDSFSMSNFKVISNSSFSANWEANLTFENRKGGLIIALSSFKVYVYHKERQPLTCAVVEDMEIDPKRRGTVVVGFDTRQSCGFEKAVNRNEVVRELKEDVKSGLLGFSLRMKISAFYRLRLLGLGTTVVLTPFCSDLNVEFLADKGGGAMVGGRNCSIPLPK